MKTSRKFIPISRKILGIDPGYGRLGFGLILSDGRNNKIIEAGLIATTLQKRWEDRLYEIAEKVEAVLKKHKPDRVILEKIFFSRNQKTALKISEIRGVILYLAKKHKIPVLEFSPNELKLGITGYGLADKKQVQYAVKMFLKNEKISETDDVFDALALALLGASFKSYPHF